MNDNTNIVDIPQIAESKNDIQPSHQVIALREEIKNFAGNIVNLLEEKDEIIEQQKQQLKENSRLISRQDAFRDKLLRTMERLERRIIQLERENDLLQKEIEPENLSKDVLSKSRLNKWLFDDTDATK